MAEFKNQVKVEGIKVKELKKTDYEGTEYYSVIQDGGLAEPKWKTHDFIIMEMKKAEIRPGDIVNLICELNYQPKINGFAIGKVVGFEIPKTK